MFVVCLCRAARIKFLLFRLSSSLLKQPFKSKKGFSSSIFETSFIVERTSQNSFQQKEVRIILFSYCLSNFVFQDSIFEHRLVLMGTWSWSLIKTIPDSIRHLFVTGWLLLKYWCIQQCDFSFFFVPYLMLLPLYFRPPKITFSS